MSSSLGLTFEPSILVIFGITGDLSRRKLLPAIYHLAEDGLLPETMHIVGVSRNDLSKDTLLANIKSSVETGGNTCKQEVLDWLESSITTITADLTKPMAYLELKQTLDSIEDDAGTCLHRLFYLSIPSKAFKTVIDQLGTNGLNTGCSHDGTQSRLLIEKPFGSNTASAQDLINTLQGTFEENQIYRIDHYLARETVQNILKFRFENPLFNTSWNKDHISHIMITAAESIGIEGRANFYEGVGAARDLIQSHLLQILALITIDQPEKMTTEFIHKAKQQLFSQIQPPTSEQMSTHTARGQYSNYSKEVENADSQTETYAAVQLSIDNDRWRDVPMLIRTGKALAQKTTEITVVFSDKTNLACTNLLTIRIQPHEGIVLDLRIKKPGFASNDIEHAQMSFCYDHVNPAHPSAYERVIIDAMRGDQTLFATSGEVLDSWRVIDPILEAWDNNQVALDTYESGSWGPESGEKLASQCSAQWTSSTPFVCTPELGRRSR